MSKQVMQLGRSTAASQVCITPLLFANACPSGPKTPKNSFGASCPEEDLGPSPTSSFLHPKYNVTDSRGFPRLQY